MSSGGITEVIFRVVGRSYNWIVSGKPDMGSGIAPVAQRIEPPFTAWRGRGFEYHRGYPIQPFEAGKARERPR